MYAGYLVAYIQKLGALGDPTIFHSEFASNYLIDP